MKNKNLSFLILAFVVVTSFIIGSCDDNNYLLPSDNLKSSNVLSSDYIPDCNFITTSSIELTDVEKEMLLFVREEEKMAHDVYQFLSGKFKKPIFDKIASSEAIHMEKVLCLLIHFNIDDPALSEAGKFTNQEIQDLYNDLIELGSGTITDALTAGAIIEDFDIKDINDWIDLTSTDPIIQVFENLVCGSGNHLVSFVEQLLSFDVIYSPQYILPDEFDTIIEAGHQDCGF